MFTWRYLGHGGEEVGASEQFDDRDAAEAWIREAWIDLLGRGIEQVTLVDETDGSRVYRMGLLEA